MFFLSMSHFFGNCDIANMSNEQQNVKKRNSHHVDVQEIKSFLMSHIENDCHNAV